MPKFTAAEWDGVRRKFRQSIMADTSLNSLAQSLDTQDWPVRGEDEKPSKYIDFTYDELLILPEIAGNANRADHLISILKETLAFDDPFGDMVAQVEESATKENPVLKTLGRLGIPEGYPLALVNLCDATRTICAAEGVKTIGEFANLAQHMSTRVVIGGDFRALLNALSHGDEEGISRFLPFRRGASGLHLAEALGLAADAAGLPRAEQLALAQAYGARLSAAEVAVAATIDAEGRERLERRVRLMVEMTLQWFRQQRDALVAEIVGGSSLERQLVVIGDPVRETIAAYFFRAAVPAVQPEPEVKKRGFFSRLWGRR